MKQVTLGHEDIEWDYELSADDKYQDTLTDDDAFMAYVRSCAHLDEPLEQAYKFHRHIANQLIRKGIRNPSHSEWAKKTIYLCQLAKKRREDMRRIFIKVHGHTAFKAELDHLDNLYPRAIWCEGR